MKGKARRNSGVPCVTEQHTANASCAFGPAGVQVALACMTRQANKRQQQRSSNIPDLDLVVSPL